MKELDLESMEMVKGSSNRQCLIDGVLTLTAIAAGAAVGQFWGAGAALIGGLFAGNANGCFE